MKKKRLYSKGEEIFNGVSHIVGGGLGIIFLIISTILIAPKGNAIEILSTIIYSISMIVLYTMSTLYHMLKSIKGKNVFQVFDHCSIFFLIAGTYTPFIILGIPLLKGYIILAAVWVLAIIGIVFNAINMHWKAVKIMSYIFYLIMGWCIIIIFPTLQECVNITSLTLLILGGVFYTIGFVFYAIGKKKKWFHSIWHLFVLVGSIYHFISVIYLILYLN